MANNSDKALLSNIKLTAEIESYKQKFYEQYLQPYDLDIPNYAMRPLIEAAKLVPEKRGELLEKARQKFELHYLSAWSKGSIKIKSEASEPMPEDVKLHLKQLSETKRQEKRAIKAKFSNLDVKEVKLPVFQDTKKQLELLAKYKWATNTFRQDPDKLGGTIVDIKCIKCSALRTIHLSDLFQCKLCLPCRKSK